MIGVVIGITGATLYVSQQAAEQSLRKGVEQLAQLGVSHFRDLQVERLRNVCSESLSFSRSIRIRQIMLRYRASLDEKDEADLIATTEILYKTAEDELREALRSDNAREHSQQAAFFRLVGPEGKVLSPPGSIDAGFLHQAGRAYLEETLSSISQAMATDQETGYLAPHAERRKRAADCRHHSDHRCTQRRTPGHPGDRLPRPPIHPEFQSLNRSGPDRLGVPGGRISPGHLARRGVVFR